MQISTFQKMALFVNLCLRNRPPRAVGSPPLPALETSSRLDEVSRAATVADLKREGIVSNEFDEQAKILKVLTCIFGKVQFRYLLTLHILEYVNFGRGLILSGCGEYHTFSVCTDACSCVRRAAAMWLLKRVAMFPIRAQTRLLRLLRTVSCICVYHVLCLLQRVSAPDPLLGRPRDLRMLVLNAGNSKGAGKKVGGRKEEEGSSAGGGGWSPAGSPAQWKCFTVRA